MDNLLIINDDNRDNAVDEEIFECLNPSNPQSFFMFAGAGSGKTRSLVNVLIKLKSAYGNIMHEKGQKIAVITYTNAACDEIKSRLGFDPLFWVSTIHSFTWYLIEPHQNDIKRWIINKLNEDIDDLNEKQLKGKTSKTSMNRAKRLDKKRERLSNIKDIRRFTYNPNGDNLEKDSLNHSEVIGIGAYLINEKHLMQTILVRKHPILLIDESQDTNKYLMNAFFNIQNNHKKQFALGLFGDTMQRIYSDGKDDLGSNLPLDWKTPCKNMNHRSSIRIIKLINGIRAEVDSQQQQHRTDKEEGFVRLFICSSQCDKDITENTVAQMMKDITNDEEWSSMGNSYQQLVLEHRMAARRLNFNELFSPLYDIDSIKTSLLDGTLPEIRFFTHLILPIIEANKNNDRFKIASVVKGNSQLMRINRNETDKIGKIRKAKNAVDDLLSLWSASKDPTCLEVLMCVANNNLFQIPEGLYPIASRTEQEQKLDYDGEEEEDDKLDYVTEVAKLAAWDKALNVPFSQMQAYHTYVVDKSGFSTHQGVKGLEYPRVMVIIDDDEAGGFLFSYDKLLAGKAKSDTDLKNEKAGIDTSIDRTRRLFYVTCSRAEKSLAVVLYSNDPQQAKTSVLKKQWFEENEIVLF